MLILGSAARSARCALLAAAALLAACSRDIQNPEAIKQGVMDYLNARAAQTGLDMSSMTMEVTTVTFDKNEARASVMFHPKGVPQGGMSMSYVLDKKGDKWVVRGRQEGGVNPHGAAGPPPGGTLPPGHPGVGSKQ